MFAGSPLDSFLQKAMTMINTQPHNYILCIIAYLHDGANSKQALLHDLGPDQPETTRLGHPGIDLC